MASPMYSRPAHKPLQRLSFDLRPPRNACRYPQRAPFCSSPSSSFPRRRDLNKNRGVSAIRSTGLRARQTIPVKIEDLPIPAKKPPPKVDPNHGLWGFFAAEARAAERPLRTSEEIGAHGRSWTVEELRAKNWEDLHALWWACVKERNMIATENAERKKLKAGYGEFEANIRDFTIKCTQISIKRALTERYYAWQDAREVAMRDPEINLFADESKGEKMYTPKAAVGYDENSIFESDDAESSKEQEVIYEGKATDKYGKEVDVEVVVKEDPALQPPGQRDERRA